VQGHPLRTDLRGTRPYGQRVLVAGEAAGLVNPLSGEGIAYALESGEMAATHARRALENGDFSETTLSAYGRALHRRYGADHQAARFLRIFFKPTIKRPGSCGFSSSTPGCSTGSSGGCNKTRILP
jgi:flavin-dependent dehydrogenase